METVKRKRPEVALSVNKPADIMKFAGTLQKFIQDNKLSCIIQGKNYVYVDGWKFAGLNFGIVPMAEDPINLSTANEYKYSCSCKLKRVADGEIVGSGFAVCTNKENKKKSFDEYAIASMAQTRAIAKAFRNLFGFVMNAAGFEATPAEEMETTKAATGNEPKSVYTQIQESVDLLNTIPELEKYFFGLPEYHKDNKFNQIIKLRKAQIQKKK